METETRSPSTVSILIVEDDSIVGDMLGVMISVTFPGVAIHTAENGRQGLELFKERRPDLVITDIGMPEMDGIEMARAIKAIKEDTPFILLTGYNDDKYLAAYAELAVTDVLVKPVDFDKLFVAIKKRLPALDFRG